MVVALITGDPQVGHLMWERGRRIRSPSVRYVIWVPYDVCLFTLSQTFLLFLVLGQCVFLLFIVLVGWNDDYDGTTYCLPFKE